MVVLQVLSPGHTIAQPLQNAMADENIRILFLPGMHAHFLALRNATRKRTQKVRFYWEIEGFGAFGRKRICRGVVWVGRGSVFAKAFRRRRCG
jgi:hypothetical protein